ncbi:hypothetical protein [Synechococcus sp. UW140]|uniref:hypothetical protein n=1 Tax=Synechococcus sp. UW140 TaxID=368503 RepID=UPI0010BDD7E9|nr:hypothetical protein [Synechococcus sp. UW140]
MISDILFILPFQASSAKNLSSKYKALRSILETKSDLYFIDLPGKIPKRLSILYNTLITHSKSKVVYYRIGNIILNIFFLFFAKTITPNAKIYVEFPTVEYFNRHAIKNSFLKFINHLIMFIFADFIVAIGVPTALKNSSKLIPARNGSVYPFKYHNCNYDINSSEILRLVCFANVSNIHGLDRILNSINNELKMFGRCPTKISLYTTFNNYCEDLMMEYRNLIDLTLFEVNPVISEINLRNEVNSYHCCIDALGRHRVHDYYNSSLKFPFYASCGIPIITSSKLDCYKLIENIQVVEANDNPIDLRLIREWLSTNTNRHAKNKGYYEKYHTWDASYKNVFDSINHSLTL